MLVKKVGLLIVTSLYLGSCTASNEEPKEPTTENLDPNAPAQPADAVPSIGEPMSSADIAAKEVAEGKVPVPSQPTFTEENADGSNPGSLTDDHIGNDPTAQSYGDATNGEPGYKPEKPLDPSTVNPPVVDPEIVTTPPQIDSGMSTSPERGYSDVAPPPSNRDGSFGKGKAKRVVKAFQLNVRQKPSRFSRIVGRVQKGDVVKVTFKGKWARLGEGQWVRSSHLSKVSTPKSKAAVKKARHRKVKAK
jgi:uncharacterized protein YgiM (DUF1202 family)